MDCASIEKSRLGAETDIVNWCSFEENRQKMVHICNVGRLATMTGTGSAYALCRVFRNWAYRY